MKKIFTAALIICILGSMYYVFAESNRPLFSFALLTSRDGHTSIIKPVGESTIKFNVMFENTRNIDNVAFIFETNINSTINIERVTNVNNETINTSQETSQIGVENKEVIVTLYGDFLSDIYVVEMNMNVNLQQDTTLSLRSIATNFTIEQEEQPPTQPEIEEDRPIPDDIRVGFINSDPQPSTNGRPNHLTQRFSNKVVVAFGEPPSWTWMGDDRPNVFGRDADKDLLLDDMQLTYFFDIDREAFFNAYGSYPENFINIQIYTLAFSHDTDLMSPNRSVSRNGNTWIFSLSPTWTPPNSQNSFDYNMIIEMNQVSGNRHSINIRFERHAHNTQGAYIRHTGGQFFMYFAIYNNHWSSASGTNSLFLLPSDWFVLPGDLPNNTLTSFPNTGGSNLYEDFHGIELNIRGSGTTPPEISPEIPPEIPPEMPNPENEWHEYEVNSNLEIIVDIIIDDELPINISSVFRRTTIHEYFPIREIWLNEDFHVMNLIFEARVIGTTHTGHNINSSDILMWHIGSDLQSIAPSNIFSLTSISDDGIILNGDMPFAIHLRLDDLENPNIQISDIIELYLEIVSIYDIRQFVATDVDEYGDPIFSVREFIREYTDRMDLNISELHLLT